MSSGPTTTNQTATAVDSTIKDVMKEAESAAITAEETAIDSAVPALALPVIKQVVDEALTLGTDWIGDNLSVALQEFGTFIVVDRQVAGEESGISKELGAIMIAEKSGDPAKIAAAIKAYQEAQSALQNDDGSAPISAT